MHQRTDLSTRQQRSLQHDDGRNRWRMSWLRPPVQLCGPITGYCDYDEATADFRTRRELPHAQGVLIINLGDPLRITAGDGRTLELGAGQGFLAGVHLRPALSASAGRQSGMQVQLPLSSLQLLTGLPMQQLQDQVVALDEVLPAGAARLFQRLPDLPGLQARVRLLDDALCGLLDGRRLDRRDQAALALLQDKPELDIMDVADRVGLSRKQLTQRITRLVGVGPRSYRRLLRFQQVSQWLRGQAGAAVDWAHLAQRSGYCDQSHLHREFREFAGLSPAQCLQRMHSQGGGLIED